MCKVLALTNTKKINLKKHLNDIGNTLLKEEKDGFGYAVQGRNGVFGEKTIAGHFRNRLSRTNEVKLPIVKTQYMQFGTSSNELTGPGVFHGRTSTNVISLVDTHPMQLDGWNLIHNGVVSDLGPNYVKTTDNDSEDVLRRLIDGVGLENPMEVIERYLQGYYAFAAIDPEGRLHVARDGVASLHIAWSAKFETYIIGTTEGLILKVSKILNAQVGPIDEIDEELYCIFQGNEMVHCQEFQPKGYTVTQSRHATASIGHEITNVIPQTIRTVFDDRSTNVGPISEADWQAIDDEGNDDSIVDFLTKGSGAGLTAENYKKYRDELDNIDASYTIYDEHHKHITIYDFKRLDVVSQEFCTVVRANGTVVDAIDYEIQKLPFSRID